MVRAAPVTLAFLTVLLAAQAAGPVAASPVPCVPEDCLSVVPIPDVPYLSGAVGFRAFGADVSVQDGLALTALRLELENPGAAATEAELALPMPDGAVLLAFNLSWPDHLLVGRVAERGQAQQEYQEAKEQGLDAAILEEASRHLVRLRVNVGAGESRILQASYLEPVAVASGARVYRLPLSQLSPLPDALSVHVDVASHLGVADLRAPDLQVPLANGRGDLDMAPSGPVDDLVLVWGEEGMRSLLVAASDPAAGMTEYWAQVCAEGAPLSRDVVFVLDRSGSMAGLKIEEAREALSGALATMRPGDRYGVVTFSSESTAFATSLVAGDSSHVQADTSKVAQIQADGGTNLDAALVQAFAMLGAAESPRLPMLVLLTDGLPTVGVTDHAQIIADAKAANTRHAPVIVVPIGLDADQTFLADLALRSGGAFVDPGAPDATLSDHLTRLAEVLAGAVVMKPSLAVENATVERMLPTTLPPLYAESCLDVRFRAQATGAGPVTLRLSGTGASGAVSSEASFAVEAIPVLPAVRSLWGQAVVAELLAEHRVEPSEALRQSIILNATAYSQLSPYTAWVLTDSAPAPEPTAGQVAGAPGLGAGGSGSAASGSSTPSYSQAPGTVGSGGNVAYDQGNGASGPGGQAKGADDADSNSTPGAAPALVAAGLALAAWAARRRAR